MDGEKTLMFGEFRVTETDTLDHASTSAGTSTGFTLK